MSFLFTRVVAERKRVILKMQKKEEQAKSACKKERNEINNGMVPFFTVGNQCELLSRWNHNNDAASRKDGCEVQNACCTGYVSVGLLNGPTVLATIATLS